MKRDGHENITSWSQQQVTMIGKIPSDEFSPLSYDFLSISMSSFFFAQTSTLPHFTISSISIHHAPHNKLKRCDVRNVKHIGQDETLIWRKSFAAFLSRSRENRPFTLSNWDEKHNIVAEKAFLLEKSKHSRNDGKEYFPSISIHSKDAHRQGYGASLARERIKKN